MDSIKRISVETSKGNTLQLFYNEETGLVVVDLIAGNEEGGCELLRRNINEHRALSHTTH